MRGFASITASWFSFYTELQEGSFCSSVYPFPVGRMWAVVNTFLILANSM